MGAWPFAVTIRRHAVRMSAAIMFLATGFTTVHGQAPASADASAPVVTANASAPSSSAPVSDIIQTSCTTCGGCGGGDCDWWCRPDASPWCNPGCHPDTCAGKFLWGFYECLCCKDPCYDPPKWLAVADAAFFVDNARPITQTRIRIDSARNLRNPDRAEYIFARLNPPDCSLVIPSCRDVPPFGKGPRVLANRVDIDELSLYQEASTGRFSLFVEVPYRQVEIDASPICPPGPDFCPSDSGFADMNVGTKSMICDCELLQFTFQFKTYIPTGNFIKGFGTAHVSLEPALLFNLNLGGDTYLQGMLAYWIPIGGDQVYQANIWHNHFSLNHILCCPCKGLQLIGTLETNLWTIYGGAYTVTDFGVPNAEGGFTIFGNSAATTIASGGPGLRLVFCDKLDIGVGSAFAYTGSRWFDDVIRTEIRWRY